jgi:hypothetical protein
VTFTVIQNEQWIHSPLFAFHFLGRTTLAQPKMTELGPAKSKTNFKFFSKIYDFPAYLSTKFCLILICIFIP